MTFQYLELSLKFYIRDCDRLIQKSVKDTFHYSVREKKIEKMPLGRLIEEFSCRSNRKDIIAVLRKLNKLRNEIAHTACILSIEEQNDLDKLREYPDKLYRINKTAKDCMKELICESSKITKQPISKEVLDQI